MWYQTHHLSGWIIKKTHQTVAFEDVELLREKQCIFSMSLALWQALLLVVSTNGSHSYPSKNQPSLGKTFGLFWREVSLWRHNCDVPLCSEDWPISRIRFTMLKLSTCHDSWGTLNNSNIVPEDRPSEKQKWSSQALLFRGFVFREC